MLLWEGIRSSSRLGCVIVHDINTGRHRIVSDTHPNTQTAPLCKLNSSVNEELPRRASISNLLYFLRKYPNQSFPSLILLLQHVSSVGVIKKKQSAAWTVAWWLEWCVGFTPELPRRDYACRIERCLNFTSWIINNTALLAKAWKANRD